MEKLILLCGRFSARSIVVRTLLYVVRPLSQFLTMFSGKYYKFQENWSKAYVPIKLKKERLNYLNDNNNMLPLCHYTKGEHIFLKDSTDMEEMDINYKTAVKKLIVSVLSPLTHTIRVCGHFIGLNGAPHLCSILRWT